MTRMEFNDQIYRMCEGFSRQAPEISRQDALFEQVLWASPDTLRKAVDEALLRGTMPSPSDLVTLVRKHHAQGKERKPHELPQDETGRTAIANPVNDRRLRLLLLLDTRRITPEQAAADMVRGIGGWHPWAQGQAHAWAAILQARAPASEAAEQRIRARLEQLVGALPEGERTEIANDWRGDEEYQALKDELLRGETENVEYWEENRA